MLFNKEVIRSCIGKYPSIENMLPHKC